ncbi:met-10+ like protein, putative [Plasmodium gallinaceum]|uniref:tRNA (guanine(37)-N1)-methyltransferase n=1 Tax=Plasmodium gallinaceum TaxID=5849 RepID=A0A1J1H085_PLAGA|nr:met-10+ like protein, putative [Plasmodium gallinaceum]CRG96692.1 met-10+ like protein, putative [Plasmodium gallinaceum]
MLFQILFLLYFLNFEYAFLIKTNKNIYSFQNMSSLNIKNLNDVKEKLRYEKNAYCLLLNKYNVNKILKNKYAKFWLLNIYKFPSVLNFKEYKNFFLKENENILTFIYNYLEDLEKNNENLQINNTDKKKTNSHNFEENISNYNEDDLRLIPLNDYFNKIIEVLMKYEKCTTFENKNKIFTENMFIDNENDSNNLENSIDNFSNEEIINKKNIENIHNINKVEYIIELFKLIKNENIKLKIVTLYFGYDNMSTSEVLRKIFPSIDEIIHKFEIIGHIAHLNFCDKLKDCKKLIGEIILDKNKSIKTVINKKDILNNLHRTFNIELLAGEENYITQLKENNIKVKLNYKLVYWNSKLKNERDRIFNLVEKNSIVIDVFGGVGIFSLLLSKKNCLCFSNDINENAYDYMNININLNKKKNILTYNLDGRNFLEKLFNLNILSKNMSTLTMFIDKQNMKNISIDFINNKFENIVDERKKKKCHLDKKNSTNIEVNNLSNIKQNENILIDKSLIEENINNNHQNSIIHENELNSNYTNKTNVMNNHISNDKNLDFNRTLDINNTYTNNKRMNLGNKDDSFNILENKSKYHKFYDENRNDIKNQELFKIDINLSIYNDIHILMNLPKTALEFLDVFRNLKKKKNEEIRNIFVHCYYFSKPEFFYEYAEKNILLHLQYMPKEMKITEIRKVSPSKSMYVVEFNLKDFFIV